MMRKLFVTLLLVALFDWQSAQNHCDGPPVLADDQLNFIVKANFNGTKKFELNQVFSILCHDGTVKQSFCIFNPKIGPHLYWKPSVIECS